MPKGMYDIFESEMFYHIYNHANGGENMFRDKENYIYFLKKYGDHMETVVDTLCYCLMPNHFHLLVRVKNEEEIKTLLLKIDIIHKFQQEYLQGLRNLEGVLSKSFSNFFNGYTKAFNEMYSRKGSLFIPRFKRKQITSNDYLTKIIHYIHYNPVHHCFCKTMDEWPFSSYKTILSNKPTKLKREVVLQWFGGSQEYINFHKWQPELKIEE